MNWSQAYLALARLLQGELEESHKLFLEVLPLISAADDSRSLCVCLLGLAATTAASGDAEHAARLWGAALKVRTASDREPEWPPWLEVEERYLDAARESLGERFVTVQAEGESVSTDDLMQLVEPRP